MPTSEATVIIGGGIVGLSTAYYLARAQNHGDTISIVDISPDLVSAASAKANGVLADYDYSAAVSDLGHLSCQLHKEFAETYDGQTNWGYTRTLRHYLSLKDDDSEVLKPQYELPAWIRGREQYNDRVRGNPKNCARVDPRKFVTFLRKQCEQLGVNIVLRSQVTAVKIEDEHVSAVTIQGPEQTYDLQCRSLVISAGSWSERIVDKLFPASLFKLDFDKTSLAGGNWLILKAPKPSGDDYCHQVYVEAISGTPVEISDYRDGRIYVGGYLADVETLPATPSDVKPQSKWIAEKKAIAMRFIDFGEDGPEVLEIGRCCRPVLAIDRPIIARIPIHRLEGKKKGSAAQGSGLRGGVFVNTGQGTSGINLGPASGLVMSELIQGLQPSVDISGLCAP